MGRYANAFGPHAPDATYVPHAFEERLATAGKGRPPAIAMVARAFAGGGDEPPQNLKEYDPEWSRAFWTGSVAASCRHDRMFASVKVRCSSRTTPAGSTHRRALPCAVLATHHAT